MARTDQTRRLTILQHPAPYTLKLVDSKGNIVGEQITVNSMSAIELEVQVALDKIRLAKSARETKDPNMAKGFENAVDYELIGIPKYLVKPKHEARAEALSR